MTDSDAMSEKVDQTKLAFVETLGKPLPAWKATFTKIAGGLGMVGSAAPVLLGAACLIGGSAITRNRPNLDAVSSTLIRIGGAIVAAGGISGILWGKAIYDSGDTAERTQKFLELSRTLDAQYTAKRR